MQETGIAENWAPLKENVSKSERRLFERELSLCNAAYGVRDELLATMEDEDDADALLQAAEARLFLGDTQLARSHAMRAVEEAACIGSADESVAAARASLFYALTGEQAGILLQRALECAENASEDSEDDLSGESYDSVEAINCVATTCADCLAFGDLSASQLLLPAVGLLHSSGHDSNEDVLGMVARKLALRNELEPTAKEVLEKSAGLYEKITSPPEQSFTAAQIAVAYCKHHEIRAGEKWMMRASRPSGGEASVMPGLLMRACAQAGLRHMAEQMEAACDDYTDVVWRAYAQAEGKRRQILQQAPESGLHKNSGALEALEKTSAELDVCWTEFNATIRCYLLAGWMTGQPRFLRKAEKAIGRVEDPGQLWDLQVEMAEAEGRLGASSLEACVNRLSRVQEEFGCIEAQPFPFEDEGPLEKYVQACTRMYAANGDARFTTLIEGVLHTPLAKKLERYEIDGILTDALRLLRSMKLDEKYRVTFFRA